MRSYNNTSYQILEQGPGSQALVAASADTDGRVIAQTFFSQILTIGAHKSPVRALWYGVSLGVPRPTLVELYHEMHCLVVLDSVITNSTAAKPVSWMVNRGKWTPWVRRYTFCCSISKPTMTSHGRQGVWNHGQFIYLFNILFMLTTKKNTNWSFHRWAMTKVQGF